MKKTYMLIALGFVTLWDTITTVYGTYKILGEGSIQLILSIFFAVIIEVHLMRTFPVLKNPSEEFYPVGLKGLWFLALFYDLFTSYKGNIELILSNSLGVEKIIVAIGLTIFVSSSPIGVSKLYYERE